ncbi:hypothetical protein BT69DRAFT_1292323 [Atractiella rhizophila]|nr:hypothetical protein BT69DRAFT_1292323 [Atractiella rhizophila]
MIGILALLALSFVQFTASVITPVGSDAEVSKFPVPPFAESPAGKWITGLGQTWDLLHSQSLLACSRIRSISLNWPPLRQLLTAMLPQWHGIAFPAKQAGSLIQPSGTSTKGQALIPERGLFELVRSLDPSLINAGRGAHPTGAEWIHGFFQESYLNTNQQVLAVSTPSFSFNLSANVNEQAVKQATARFLDPLQGLVVLTGHSLGAAVSVLDSLQLRINLDPNIAIQTVGYGQPRVGNDAFALYYDQLLYIALIAYVMQLGNNTLHYTNWRDPVPRLPEQILGFVQTQNEFFNQTTYECLRCPDCSICDANKKPDEPGCDPFTCNPNQGQVNYCPVDPGNGPPPFENYKCAAQFRGSRRSALMLDGRCYACWHYGPYWGTIMDVC